MRKTFTNLQELRRRIYCKAKADKTWRFWGIYVHVCKLETLRTAYDIARKNKGAPGIDGITFEAIEASGVEEFLEEIQLSLISKTYQPMRNRCKEIPKGTGKNKTRIIRISTIRDRVVQGAMKLILEPVFEADFQKGSFGGRPKRSAHQAIGVVSNAIVKRKTKIIDIDLKSYFDTIRHDQVLRKVAGRIRDNDILWLLKRLLKANGKIGLTQGSVLSPLLSNLYLNEVDKMLEEMKFATKVGQYTHIEYARFLDDLIVLVDEHRKWEGLVEVVIRKLKEEFTKLGVEINTDKTKVVIMSQQEGFGFLGFNFRQRKTRQGKMGVQYSPMIKSRTKVLQKVKEILRVRKSQPIEATIKQVNQTLRGWVNYFRIGHSGKCFSYVKQWTEKKIRRQMMKARQRRGFGWKKWSKQWLYEELGLFNDYQVQYQP